MGILTHGKTIYIKTGPGHGTREDNVLLMDNWPPQLLDQYMQTASCLLDSDCRELRFPRIVYGKPEGSVASKADMLKYCW